MVLLMLLVCDPSRSALRRGRTAAKAASDPMTIEARRATELRREGLCGPRGDSETEEATEWELELELELELGLELGLEWELGGCDTIFLEAEAEAEAEAGGGCHVKSAADRMTVMELRREFISSSAAGAGRVWGIICTSGTELARTNGAPAGGGGGGGGKDPPKGRGEGARGERAESECCCCCRCACCCCCRRCCSSSCCC